MGAYRGEEATLGWGWSIIESIIITLLYLALISCYRIEAITIGICSLIPRPSSPSILSMINLCLHYYRGIAKREVGEEGLGTRLGHLGIPVY